MDSDAKQRLLSEWAAHVDSTSADEKPGLEDAYRSACQTTSDINEHLPTLQDLSSKSGRVIELAVRPSQSTLALLAGRPASLRAVSMEDGHHQTSPLIGMAQAANVPIAMEHGDPLEIAFGDADLLFTDTRHTYAQLKGELGRYAHAVRKWIVIHDTETFGLTGEDGGDGLLRAITEFLGEHGDWDMQDHYKANNGLTVLRRWDPEQDDSRGLGDTVAKFTHFLGVDKAAEKVAKAIGLDDCGCAGRQATFNSWFGYKK